ncbi:MAG: hypothetical protein ACRDJC_23125, partial [Thermomicrobiales bacterium]
MVKASWSATKTQTICRGDAGINTVALTAAGPGEREQRVGHDTHPRGGTHAGRALPQAQADEGGDRGPPPRPVHRLRTGAEGGEPAPGALQGADARRDTPAPPVPAHALGGVQVAAVGAEGMARAVG